MEKKKEFIVNAIYIAIIVGLVYLAVNYIFGLILPFIMGFIFAYIAVKTCRKLFNEDKRIYRIFTLVVIYLLIVLIIYLLVSMGISKIGDFIKNLPGFYKNTMEPYISSLEATVIKFSEFLPDGVSDVLNDLTGDIFEIVKSALSSAASGLVNITTSALSSAPEMLVSVIITIVSSAYIVSDYEMIADWFTSILSDKALEIFYEIKDFAENTLLKILSAYISIMFVTFIELFIGLTIFRVGNSGMWAMIIALMDILPVLGVGTVLIPWGISSLITGNFVLGIELLVLYFIIAFIRNIIEPKMVGTNLGLHPLATLFAMIVGLRLFGAVGMFGGPLTLSFFQNRKHKNVENKNTNKDNKKQKQKE